MVKNKVIMIMVDGFGIPENGWAGSIYEAYCGPEFVKLMSDYSIPLDSCMGVAGIPQSATGQATLFSGINTAELLGMHQQGFPGPTLKKLVQENNLFQYLLENGLTVSFANAYVRMSLEELEKSRLFSVTSVMAAAALSQVRNRKDLLAGHAVYHDLTRKTLQELSIPLISPLQSAGHLLDVAREYDFTLFEYFLTDLAGHRPDFAELEETLREFGKFFCSLVNEIADDWVLILTGDHGNCEDPSTRQHTLNPVPFFIYNHSPHPSDELHSLDQVCRFIMEHIYQLETA